MRRRLATITATAAGLAAAGLVGGFLFAWTGLFNLGADTGHWPITRWFLGFGMRNSVETHAMGLTAPDLDDPGLIRRGAGHYESGCAPCHGTPGRERNPIVQRMLPAPPHIVEAVPAWTGEQLYWIVRHGVKYAGMPAWPAEARDDEPWALAAFLRQVATMDPATYESLAYGDQTPDPRGADLPGLTGPDRPARSVPAQSVPAETVPAETVLAETVLAGCARCHGLDGRGSDAFPRLAGQSPDYLFATLQAYATGVRPSGIMQPMAQGLSDDVLRTLADHYAGRGVPPTPPPDPDPARVERGRQLALEGAPQRGVPACAGCHGPGRADRNPRFPELAGQPVWYLRAQLDLWRRGIRGGSPLAELMVKAAERLTDEQVEALSLFYATQTPATKADLADMRP